MRINVTSQLCILTVDMIGLRLSTYDPRLVTKALVDGQKGSCVPWLIKAFKTFFNTSLSRPLFGFIFYFFLEHC